MSCKHLIWDCYCKHKQDFCEKELFPTLCENYRREDEVADLRNVFNKGPSDDIDVNPNCSNKYPFEYRLVLTLILGYLGKLDSITIINCENPETYFEDKVADVCVPDFTVAMDKVRLYIKESNALVLAEGMRRFEAWMERLRSKSIPPKELTIADIEKQLGYKIKIVGEEK